MRLMVYFWCLLSSWLVADEGIHVVPLVSEDFEERQKAEKELTAWAQEEETEERAEALFQRYLASEDPEEFHRLTNILLAVHFETKKDEIPQTGSGFIGISMGPQQLRGRFQQQRFGQGQGQFQNVIEPEKGVFIDSIIEGTPAEKAGLLAGDMITEINGESIAGADPPGRLKEIVGAELPGTKLTLTVEREKKIHKKVVTLMNAEAVPFGDEPRVDREKELQLLKGDYLRWLVEQRTAHRKE